MLACVTGIVVLQLYANYRNYQQAAEEFDRNINTSLERAVEGYRDSRRANTLIKVRDLLNDTNQFGITWKVNPTYNETVFSLNDFLASKGQRIASMSFNDYNNESLSSPSAIRRYFIERFIKNIDIDLKRNYVFYYTQSLGDSIEKVHFGSPTDTQVLRKFFKHELEQRGIRIPFQFKPYVGPEVSATKKVSLAMRDSEPERLRAYFVNPGLYLLKEQKYLMAGSLFLILITIFCFGYTVKTLLDQKKLAEIKAQFINNMTHEINTPISSISITTEALQKFDYDEATRSEYLTIIQHQADQLKLISRSILDAARYEQQLIAADEQIDLEALINELIAEQNTLDQADIVFTKQGKLPVTIRGNSVHLRRAIFNLLDNAVKYNHTALPEINIDLFVQNANVVLCISDRGPGIPDDQKALVFN